MSGTARAELPDLFRRRPLFYAFLAVAAGAALAWQGAPQPPLLFCLALLALALVPRGPGWLRLPVLLFALLGAGSALLPVRPPADDVSRLAGRVATVVGSVIDDPLPRRDHAPAWGRAALEGDAGEERWRFTLRVEAVSLDGETWARAGGLLAVNAPPRPTFGDRLELRGVVRAPRPVTNPGGASQELLLRRRGITATLAVAEPHFRLLEPADHRHWSAAGYRLRRLLMERGRHGLSPETAYVVSCRLVGETAPPPGVDSEALREAFRNAGTIHVLVVSGMQVTLLILFIFLAGRVSLSLRPLLALAALAVVLLYSSAVGWHSSVARAAAMGVIAAGALVFHRRPDVENSLGFAGLTLFLAEPYALFDLGLQLSMAAVWGLARLGPALLKALGWPWREEKVPVTWRTRLLDPRSWARGAAALLIVSAAIYLCVSPILGYHFQRNAPVTPFANVFVVPAAIGLFFASLAHVVVGGVTVLGNLTAGACEVLSRWMVGWTQFWAGVPGAHGPVFPLPWWGVLAFLAMLFGSARLLKHQHRAAGFLGLVLATALLWTSERLPARPPAEPTAIFLDVGQGDAALIRLPGGGTVLVDGGGRPLFDVGEQVLLPALRALRVPRLDVVIATHPHADHVGGLLSVARDLEIGLFLASGQVSGSALQRDLLLTLRERGVPLQVARPGDRVDLPGGRLVVLGPAHPPLAGTRSDLNNNSVAVRLEAGGSRLLLPGDAEAEQEAALLAAGADLRAAVLKVGHHGSRTSSTAAWVEAVRPRLAVISCGAENTFGHPAPEVVERLAAAGARVYRTDEHGAVTVLLRPEGPLARSFLRPEVPAGENAN